MRPERAVEASEVSGPRRRVATGIVGDPEAPDGEKLRPLARALVDLAIALVASDEEREDE